MKQKMTAPLKLHLGFFAETPPSAPAGDSPAMSRSDASPTDAAPPASPPDQASPAELPAGAAPPAAPPGQAEPETPLLTPDDIKKLVSSMFEEQAAKQTEAEKLAKMTADEKAEYERQTREVDYNNRLAELTRKELRIEAHKTLADRGLPVELLDALQYDSAESMATSMKSVEKAFRAAVEVGVNDRLRGTPPGASATPATLTLDRIKNMSQAEIMANMPEIEKTLAAK